MKRHTLLCSTLVILLLGGMEAEAATHSKKKSGKSKVARAWSAARSKMRAKRPAYPQRPRTGPLSEFLNAAVPGGPWREPTYADSTAGDQVDGEDLEVRRVAVEALGQLNGSVVVVDPADGRILTVVNQKLAFGEAFQPCSTVKVPVALAALSEGLIDSTTPIRVKGRTRLNMTDAMARSDNHYFAHLGVQLGYEKMNYYARLFGYGERAGLDIPGESQGSFPQAAPKNGGMGMLASFGEEIGQTPLQLAALMAAMANGGTLYYLQYPRSQEEVENFAPRIKRRLDILDVIPEVKEGMFAAVQNGTARRAWADDPIAGKTGTCTQSRTHLGWFGSFNDAGGRKLAVVVLLTGGRPAIGPAAAGIAGEIYRQLAGQNYYARKSTPFTPATLLTPLPR
ncbi:MAG: penicillin-binding protein [Acidobacteria bacterium]|nr:penicillin-binding protein [Acidobacteriota bacterium]